MAPERKSETCAPLLVLCSPSCSTWLSSGSWQDRRLSRSRTHTSARATDTELKSFTSFNSRLKHGHARVKVSMRTPDVACLTQTRDSDIRPPTALSPSARPRTGSRRGHPYPLIFELATEALVVRKLIHVCAYR